ncbi:hypothetical protein L6452_31046 [Arctium lappa]|uniref:Uncharacterized protein n=1 Tax=Arctium lappa TaxID=4217 RepID=A0ACB8ZJU6_ARCLA|nr:hypothetical protein L6452_31046 [Arctium lappa]
MRTKRLERSSLNSDLRLLVVCEFWSIIRAREKEIKEKEKEIKRKEDMIVTIEKEIKLKDRKITNLQSQLKTTEQKTSELQAESVELQQKLKDTFAKERKVLEEKVIKSPKQISVLQDLLEKERKAFQEMKKSFEIEKKNTEKRNVGIFKEISEKTKNIEKEFEQERQIFENEISKLTSKISVVSSDFQKEQLARSDLKQKFDTLIVERNILTEKIKQLEVVNVELSEKISADVISQSPYDNSTESVCSFKTASSSIHENVFKKNSVKPNIVKSNQIHPSNLFYDKTVDSPGSFYVKSLGKHSKKGQMVWRVKVSPDDESKKDKSFTSTTNVKKNRTRKGKYFGTPDMFYSTNHLIRLAQKKIYCSYCRGNDFV